MFRYYIDLGHNLASALPLFPRENVVPRPGIKAFMLHFSILHASSLFPGFHALKSQKLVPCSGLSAAACEPDCAVIRFGEPSVAMLPDVVRVRHPLQCYESLTVRAYAIEMGAR